MMVYADSKSLETAKAERDKAIYLSECGANAGIRKINSDKASWLSEVIYYAEKYLAERKEQT